MWYIINKHHDYITLSIVVAISFDVLNIPYTYYGTSFDIINSMITPLYIYFGSYMYSDDINDDTYCDTSFDIINSIMIPHKYCGVTLRYYNQHNDTSLNSHAHQRRNISFLLYC